MGVRLPELLVIFAIIVLVGGYKKFPEISQKMKESVSILKKKQVSQVATGEPVDNKNTNENK